MKKNAKAQTRIAIVPDRTDDCAICHGFVTGCHFDHDLAALNHGNGHVCYSCSAALIFAEDFLVKTAGICLPGCDDGSDFPPMPPDPHASIP